MGKGDSKKTVKGGGAETKNEKEATRRTEKVMTRAMREAAYHVKDFMTDNQKALIYLKVGKQMLDRGKYRDALEVLAGRVP